jgi:flagellar biosynthesis regulator FlbT
MILTSKEEAEKIVDKFRNEITSFLGDNMKKLNGIKCALIAVDMILDIKSVYKDEKLYNHWHEIQQELEKLKNERK